jgi:hypothetical protein
VGGTRACLICGLLMTCAASSTGRVGFSAQTPGPIVVRLGASVAPEGIDGRLLLLMSRDGTREPRFQVSATSLSSGQV